MGSFVIGVDVGTTGAKAVLLSSTGQIVAEAGEEYLTHYLEPGGAEQDPDDWWRTSARCIARVLDRGGVPAREVGGVGVSSQAPSLVVVDAAGRPVRPALLWLDRRGRAACEARAAHAADILTRTGNRLDAYFAAPKLAWLLAAEPEVRRVGRQVLMANGYVVRMLTGHATCDSGHVGLSLMGDLASGRWSADLAEVWGVPAAWLPEVAEPSAVAGTVTPEAASATGLLAGTPVVTGVVDGAAASLEAGVASHGDVCEMTGQSTVVNAAVDAARLRHDALGTVSVLPYPIPGHHLVYGSMVATGGILRWFREEFGDRERALAGPDGDVFGALDQLAGEAPLGSGGLVLLPYFLGERSPIWDADARGALVGLSMGSRRSDLVRAILEATAYGLAHNLDELARLGLRPAMLRSVGGGAKGRTWNQIKADVTGLPIELPRAARGAPVGAALVAAAGVGIVEDLAATVRARTELAERIEPDAGRHAAYKPYLRIYRDLYPALRRTYEQLAAVRSAAHSGTGTPDGNARPNPDP